MAPFLADARARVKMNTSCTRGRNRRVCTTFARDIIRNPPWYYPWQASRNVSTKCVLNGVFGARLVVTALDRTRASWHRDRSVIVASAKRRDVTLCLRRRCTSFVTVKPRKSVIRVCASACIARRRSNVCTGDVRRTMRAVCKCHNERWISGHNAKERSGFEGRSYTRLCKVRG